MLEALSISEERYIEVSQHVDPQDAVGLIVDYVHARSIDFVVNNDNPFVAMSAPCLPCPILSVGHLSTTSVAALACYQHEWLDYVVAISEDMKATFANKYKVPPAKLRIVYNGVEVQHAEGESVSKPDSKPLQVVFAGGLNRRKGGDKILDILHKIRF